MDSVTDVASARHTNDILNDEHGINIGQRHLTVRPDRETTIPDAFKVLFATQDRPLGSNRASESKGGPRYNAEFVSLCTAHSTGVGGLVRRLYRGIPSPRSGRFP